jgi:hypothetical protein
MNLMGKWSCSKSDFFIRTRVYYSLVLKTNSLDIRADSRYDTIYIYLCLMGKTR